MLNPLLSGQCFCCKMIYVPRLRMSHAIPVLVAIQIFVHCHICFQFVEGFSINSCDYLRVNGCMGRQNSL